MTIEETRNIVADMLEQTHGNPAFIRQVRDGLQDDGPYMRAGIAMMLGFNRMMAPAPEVVE